MIVADLDRFKEVNDRGGHRLGDAALQRVAAILARGKREIDSLARVGGSEFALVLPDTDEHGALRRPPSGCAARCATSSVDAACRSR